MSFPIHSILKSASTTTKALALGMAALALAASFAACVAGPDTDSSDAELRNADTERLPELPYHNR